FPLGIAFASNSLALFNRAGEFVVRYVLDRDIDPAGEQAWFRQIHEFVTSVDMIHLTIDLDVLPAATMPAVSAPAGRGVSLPDVESIIHWVLQLGTTAAVDLVEFNPAFDPDGRAVRVAAWLAWDVANRWSG